jgi:hypothetical protein
VNKLRLLFPVIWFLVLVEGAYLILYLLKGFVTWNMVDLFLLFGIWFIMPSLGFWFGYTSSKITNKESK